MRSSLLVVPALALFGAACSTDLTDEDDFTELVSRVDALAEEVDELQAENAALQEQLATANSERTAITARVTTLENQTDVALAEAVAALETDVQRIDTQLTDQSPALTSLSDLLAYLTVDSDADTVTFSGANISILNGAGDTYTANGLGNLFLGYASTTREVGECVAGVDAGDICLNDSSCTGSSCDFEIPAPRSGSHNLYVGDGHLGTGSGSILAGLDGTASADHTFLAGQGNVVSAQYASIPGGRFGEASAIGASICGGNGGLASGTDSSISGGSLGRATAQSATVSGGLSQVADSAEEHVP
ncbi:MAG: hypothetical protein AAFQ77_03180 [Myxococcota bacterium]